MKIRTYLLWLCFLPFCQTTKGQEQYSDTIPYLLVANKMIIQANVNGIKGHFIFDTGGQNVMMLDSAKARNVKFTGGTTTVSDMNSKTSNFRTGQVDKFAIGNRYKLKEMGTMIMGNTKSLSSLGVSGILGNEAFAQAVISILPKAQKLVISYPYRPKSLSRKDAIPFRTDKSFHPFINLQLSGQTLEVLFDTGADNLLMLSSIDYNRLQQHLQLKPADSAYGILYVGVGGIGAPYTMHKLSIPKLQLAGKTFINTGTTTTNMAASIMGIELLKYGEITIDYPRSSFYFKPYDENEVSLTGPAKGWNANILPVVDHFQISNIWSSAAGKLKFGERVSNINGTSLENMELSAPLIDAIMARLPGNTAYLLVGPKGKERKVIITKN